MPSFNPSAVSVQSSKKYYGTSNGGANIFGNGGYNQMPSYGNNIGYSNNLLGSGNLGPDVMSRVFMSFRSGIDSEIKWALTTTCSLSLSQPNLINFEKFPVLGNELIKYFTQPYLNPNIDYDLNFSLDALLTLRNASQDLVNQQWLSQLKNLRKTIITVLKTLVNWIYLGKDTSHRILQHTNQYHESFKYLLDLIETLSCYYIDNNKNDPLFHQIIIILSESRDKAVILSALKSLGNLLIIREKREKVEPPAGAVAAAATAIAAPGTQAETTAVVAESAESADVNEPVKIPTNCIDAIPLPVLQQIAEYLLLNDAELDYAVLQFLKQYLSSEALNPLYPTVAKSQQFRLSQIIGFSNKTIFRILVKQLPQLILATIPLTESSRLPELSPQQLSKRALHTSVPTIVPELTDQLYNIIVKFHEPLRASTWLRCCYEPIYQQFTGSDETADKKGNNLPVPGEVTQISLWKAYEKQFEKVWQAGTKAAEGDVTPTAPSAHPKLLPAVDFIKNVSAAFPHSQAMVVNIDSEIPGQAPKRKFIIKGIQPRQFVVNIDVGNYDALKQKPSKQVLDSEQESTNSELPIGHVDYDKFYHQLDRVSNIILHQSGNLNRNQLPMLNLIGRELMEYITNFETIVEDGEEASNTETDFEELKSIIRYENNWIRDFLYTNPGLIDGGILSEKWLEYLV